MGGVVGAVAAHRAGGGADARGVHQDAQVAELAGAVDGGGDLGGVGDVDVGEGAAELVGQRLTLVVLHVGDEHLRPGRRELPGDRGADARGGPR